MAHTSTPSCIIVDGTPSCTPQAVYIRSIVWLQGMQAVRRFPSFGELADLGGPGPSLGLLYEFGNAYIEANASWARMGQVSQVHVGIGKSAARGATRREQT